MSWSLYEVFAVLSGIAMVLLSAAPGLKSKDRAWYLIGGLVFAAYGVFVATQSTGTFYFPIWIFLIPPVAVIYGISQLVGRKAGEGPISPTSSPVGIPPQVQAPDVSPQPIVGTAPAAPVAPAAPSLLHAAAWHPDPQRRYEYRYWDGATWTDDVATGGMQGKEPATVPTGVPQVPYQPQLLAAGGSPDSMPWNMIVAGSLAGLLWPLLDAVAANFQVSYWFITLATPANFDPVLASGSAFGRIYWYVSLGGLMYCSFMLAIAVLSLRRSALGPYLALAGAATSFVLLCVGLFQSRDQLDVLVVVALGRFLAVAALLGAGGLMLAVNEPLSRPQSPQAW